jgi:hypothetical protein
MWGFRSILYLDAFMCMCAEKTPIAGFRDVDAANGCPTANHIAIDAFKYSCHVETSQSRLQGVTIRRVFRMNDGDEHVADPP